MNDQQQNHKSQNNTNYSILNKLANCISNRELNNRSMIITNKQQDQLMEIEIESKYEKIYEEICNLGSGNGGTVYKCKSKIDNQFYAIKKSTAKFKQTIYNSQIRQEACFLAKIFSQTDNKNIIRYYNSWIEYNQIFISMEYCDYNLKQKQIYQEWEIKCILKDVLNGLNFLHQNGYAHMDIKPENILFKNSQVTYKIADFELSRQKQTNLGEDICDGDSRYLAPEIMEYSNYQIEIDLSKVDIFAFGCTLYEIINQIEMPKMGQDYDKIRNGINKQDFKNNQNVVYSEELIDIICQMMCPDRNNRPSAEQLLNTKYLNTSIVKYTKYLQLINDVMMNGINLKKELYQIHYRTQSL